MASAGDSRSERVPRFPGNEGRASVGGASAGSGLAGAGGPGAGSPGEALELVEVTLGELDRRASRVIARVRAGELVVVSKHGLPVAAILPLREAIAWAPPELVMEGRGRILAGEFARRELRQTIGRLIHARPDQRDLNR